MTGSGDSGNGWLRDMAFYLVAAVLAAAVSGIVASVTEAVLKDDDRGVCAAPSVGFASK